jgi:hypothetical protein
MASAFGGSAVIDNEPSSKTNNVYSSFNGRPTNSPRADSGSAACFFYCAKASKDDRDEGLTGLSPKQRDESRKEGNRSGDNPRNMASYRARITIRPYSPLTLCGTFPGS